MIIISGTNSLGTSWWETSVCKANQMSVDLDSDIANLSGDLILIKPNSNKSLNVITGRNLSVPGSGLVLKILPQGNEAGRTHIVLESATGPAVSWSRDRQGPTHSAP